jgi:phosphoribosylglycinamide formyltransferase-1
VGDPLRVAVLASGGGSNLQALIDRFNNQSRSAARVELVVASRGGIGALERAKSAAIPTLVQDTPAAGAQALADALLTAFDSCAIDLVVLAGYLRLIPSQVIRHYQDRIINIHPALLPAFGGAGMYGLRVHQAVLAAGTRVSGATVHVVDEAYDSGAILAQWPVPVLADDSPESLAARILAVEHRLLPTVVEQLARGRSVSTTPTDPVSFTLSRDTAPSEDLIHPLISFPRDRRVSVD